MKKLSKTIFESTPDSRLRDDFDQLALLVSMLYLKSGKPVPKNRPDVLRDSLLDGYTIGAKLHVRAHVFDKAVERYVDIYETYIQRKLIIPQLFSHIDQAAEEYLLNSKSYNAKVDGSIRSAKKEGHKINLSPFNVELIFKQTWQLLEKTERKQDVLVNTNRKQELTVRNNRYVSSDVLKKAVLRKFNLSENQIVPEGRHSHKYGYEPRFVETENGISIHFCTGKTENWNEGGTWDTYSGWAFVKKDQGEYKVSLNWMRQKNSYECPIVSEKDMIPYQGFATYEEARAKLLNYFGL